MCVCLPPAEYLFDVPDKDGEGGGGEESCRPCDHLAAQEPESQNHPGMEPHTHMHTCRHRHTHTETHTHACRHTQQAHGHRSARTYACTHTHITQPHTLWLGVLSVLVQTGPRSPIVQVDHRGHSPRRHGVVVYTRSSGNQSVDRMKRK